MQKDDTNISDGEEDALARGRVNSMRTNIRDLAGSITDTNRFKQELSLSHSKELSLKNSSFSRFKNLPSSHNPSAKDEESVSESVDSSGRS